MHGKSTKSPSLREVNEESFIDFPNSNAYILGPLLCFQGLCYEVSVPALITLNHRGYKQFLLINNIITIILTITLKTLALSQRLCLPDLLHFPSTTFPTHSCGIHCRSIPNVCPISDVAPFLLLLLPFGKRFLPYSIFRQLF